MRAFIVLAFISCSMLLMACPLQTTHPIEGMRADVPSWLKGRWVAKKENSEIYVVNADAKEKGKLSIDELDASGKIKGTTRKAYLSKIKGSYFLSVFDAGDEVSDNGYYQYLVEKVGDDGLQLTALQEHIITSDTDGKAIADCIKSHDADEYLNRAEVSLFSRP